MLRQTLLATFLEGTLPYDSTCLLYVPGCMGAARVAMHLLREICSSVLLEENILILVFAL